MGAERRIDVGDAELVVESHGEGEPVLLLHGLGGARQDWAAQVASLARERRVVTLDLRGHGQSEPGEHAITIPRLAADVARVIDAMGLAPLDVVGLSMGGMVAFQLAVDAPALVRSLVIVNSGPEMVPRGPRDWLFVGQRLLLARLLGPARLAPMIARRVFPGDGAEQLARRRMLTQRLAANDPHSYLAATRAIVGWSVASRLHEITCPVLVVAGDRDYTPVAVKAAYVRRLRDARLVVVADSGHATPVDQPEALGAALEAFWRGLTRPAARALMAADMPRA